jgi:hypothetical protein
MKLTTKHVSIIAFSITGFVAVHHYFFELRTIKKEGIYLIGFVTDFQYRARTSVCYYHFYFQKRAPFPFAGDVCRRHLPDIRN